MKPKSPGEVIFTDDSIDTNPVAGRLVMARAIELALIDGRSAIDLSITDWQQAKRELIRLME